MRLTLDGRAQRLLRRLPHNSVYSALEIVLLAVLAWQIARLIWAIVTPVSPLGDWRRDGQASVAASPAIFSAFDPFFRLSQGGGPVVITGLALKLYGVREDRATGRGSAIIGLPDGTQGSYGIGEEIMPGVTLSVVGPDNVTIKRGETPEQLFLDQSQSATPVTSVMPPPGGSVMPAPPASSQAGPNAQTLMQDTQFSPRRQGDKVTGYSLHPRGAASAFFAAGFQPGDVVLAVNGAPVGSADPSADLGRQLQAGGEAQVDIERGGQRTTLRVKLGQ